MNLSSLLQARNASGRPVRVGLIGAGKFGSMVLAQARHIEGLHVVGVADLDVGKARASLARVGWPAERYGARTLADAVKTGATCVLDDAAALAACDEIECIIEATGHPIAGVRHALAAIEGGKHVVMVNVEADVMCGPLLAARARERKDLVYSMAYGDQPAIICELVDWVRSCGFELTSAGKGMNFEPRYRYSTPDTVWGFFGWTEEEVAKGDFNPKMYNSFTDGTKAAIEMAAVANGTGLDCPDDGLAFPPAGLHDLARVFRPAEDGGRLSRSGLVDIAASQEPDGREVFNNIRYGVFVTFKAPNEYARACFKQYGLLVDPIRLVRLDVAPVPHDRPRNQRERAVGGAARRADGIAEGVPRRRGGDRQARPQAGRDARRRRRLRGLGQCDPGIEEPRDRRPADRARAQRQAEAPGRQGHHRVASRMSNWNAISTWSRCGARWSRARSASRRRQREARTSWHRMEQSSMR